MACACGAAWFLMTTNVAWGADAAIVAPAKPAAGKLALPGDATTSPVTTNVDFRVAFAGKRVTHGSRHGKLVALTFDDGPDPTKTPQVVEILKKENAKATFFMLGSMVSQSPRTAKLVADAGFEIGDHSISHANLSKASPDRVWHEIDGTRQTILDATGQTAHLFRPPYGYINKNVRASAQKAGMALCLWSIDTNDWKAGATPEKIVGVIGKELSNGAIILMHDIHPKTVAALPDVIKLLKARGYEMVTVSELLEKLAQDNATAPQGGDATGETEAAGQDATPAAPLTMSLSESSKY